jgi:hypothetical protein
MRGTREWGRSFDIEIGVQHFVAVHARGYTRDGSLAAPFRLNGSELAVQCSPGVLHVDLAEAGRRDR